MGVSLCRLSERRSLTQRNLYRYGGDNMVADSNNKTSSAIEASREELLDLGLDGPKNRPRDHRKPLQSCTDL